MATSLGWPARQLAWADVLKLEAEPDAWASRGHPEWGSFKLGQTDPTVSTSGLHAFIGIFSAAVEARNGTALPAPIAPEDTSDPKVIDFVRAVESRVAHYTDTVTTFEQHLQVAADLAYISAIAMEEQEVWSYNHAKPKVRLAAVYPREGTLFADHPYVVLTEPWVDTNKRAAAARFLDFLLSHDSQQTFQRNGFRDGNTPYPVPDDTVINVTNGLLPTQPALRLTQPSPQVLQKIVQSWPAVH
jgi:Ca-activated chloride channel family protein